MHSKELYKKVKKDYKKYPATLRAIAKNIIYTKNKSANRVASEIIYWIKEGYSL